jgi:PKD repeat protein
VTPTQATAGPDVSMCIDGPDIQLNGTPVSGTWSGSFVSPTGLFNPTNVGVFNLVISNGAGNCLTRDTTVVTVFALPVVTAGPDDAFCPSDAPVNFTGAPMNGTWSGNGIIDSSIGTFDPSIASIATNQLIYTFTDPITGCMNRDTALAVVHPMPVASFNLNPITCIGTNETFTNTSTLANQNAWDFGDGTTSSATNPAHSYSNAGFYTIELVVTTAFGCLDSITEPIEVRIPPVADFNIVPDSACGPLLANFNDFSLGQNLTYTWDYGNGQTSTGPTPLSQTYQASNSIDTAYTVTLNLTNFCGTSSHSEMVTVMPSPTAVFGTNTNIGCTPLILDLVNNSFGLIDNVVWNFGDGTSSTDTSSTLQHTFYTGNSDTVYTIELIVSNECGTDTIQHQVTVVPPQVNAFFNIDAPSGCVAHTINLTQFSQGAIFSSWDFGDGNISSQYNPSHTYTSPGTYTVSLYAAGCGYDTATTTVTVHPMPQIDFSLLDSSCVNQAVSFLNQSTNIASVSWDFGDGTTSTLTNPTHTYLNPGIYTVTLSGISQTYGCTTQIAKSIQINPSPNASMSLGTNNGCVSLTVQFTNTSIAGSTQFWDFGDGNTSLLANPTHTYTTAGSYAVNLIAINSLGCTDTATQVVNVYPLPVVDFITSTLDSCLQPSTYNFSNLSTNTAAYSWNFGNGLTSTLTNPSTSYNQPGSYTVTLVGTSMQGCVDSIQKTVQSYQMASGTFTLPVDSICLGESVNLQASTQFSTGSTWILGDGNVLTGNPISYTYGGSGNFNIVLIVSGAGGCNDTVSAGSNIVVLPQPTADFSYSNVQTNGSSTGQVAFTNLSSGANYYSWDFGNGMSSIEENPSVFYPTSGGYIVTLISENNYGCMDTASISVDVDFYYGLFIPNAISPGNSDFQVANFIPKGVGLKTFELLIYDDWGNLIWSTNALDADGRPTEYWDGTFNGVPVQQDAYVWKATATFRNEEVWEGKEYPNGKKKRSGSVTVIR